MMADALNLVIYGMGTVFVFLTVLVFLTTLMSKLVALTAAPIEQVQDKPMGSTESTVSPVLLSAITAAVKQYRERH